MLCARTVCKMCAGRCYLVMSLGSERDDEWGEDESQEQGTSDTINAASASSFSQRFLGEALSSAMVVSLQLPRELHVVSGRRIGRSISWSRARLGASFVHAIFVAMISPLPLVVCMKWSNMWQLIIKGTLSWLWGLAEHAGRGGGGGCPAKMSKILQNLRVCPAKNFLGW